MVQLWETHIWIVLLNQAYGFMFSLENSRITSLSVKQLTAPLQKRKEIRTYGLFDRVSTEKKKQKSSQKVTMPKELYDTNIGN